MERHDIRPDWNDPAANGGFGGKRDVSRETVQEPQNVPESEKKEEVTNEPNAKP
jgi:hypothetical protein